MAIGIDLCCIETGFELFAEKTIFLCGNLIGASNSASVMILISAAVFSGAVRAGKGRDHEAFVAIFCPFKSAAAHRCEGFLQ